MIRDLGPTGYEEERIMESVDSYRKEMKKHLPERDDSRLLEYHKDTVERVMANIEGVKQKVNAYRYLIKNILLKYLLIIKVGGFIDHFSTIFTSV